LLKERWENPIILPIETNTISFISIDSPQIINVMNFITSSSNSIRTEMLYRGEVAKSTQVFSEDIDIIYNGNIEFIRKLYIILNAIDDIIYGTDRCLSLCFGLTALLENHFLKHYGEPDFSLIEFSKENASLFPDILENKNFFGTDENFEIIKLRLFYLNNILNSKKELNIPSNLLPRKLIS